MNSGRSIFAQVVELIPRRAFDLAVERYDDKRVGRFSCMDQFLCMVFAQLTGRTSLRETATCLRAMGARRYHCGIRMTPARSTLAPSEIAQILGVLVADRADSLPDRARGGSARYRPPGSANSHRP